jgi:uncharacterized membrane protein YdjX (TVP38/TMEM64 family)
METMRWASLAVILLGTILVPYLVFEERLAGWTAQLLAPGAPRWIAAATVAGLLAVDVVLPIPSSVVSTGAGFLLGPWWGAGAGFLGMTAGTGLGYAVGRISRPAAQRLIGPTELARAEQASRRLGMVAVALLRPVPVLAEASSVLAGMMRMPRVPFLALTALANLVLSLGYAWLGAALR